MAHYQGSNAEGSKARTLAAEREDQAIQFKRKQEEIKQANKVKLVDMNDAFQSKNSMTEEAFKASTVGLVSAEDFKKKRLELEARAKAEEEEKKRAAEKQRKRKGKEREEKLKALSFNMDEEEEYAAASSSSTTAAASSSTAEAAVSSSEEPPNKKAKSAAAAVPVPISSGKDPLADTSFLPDREREAKEAALRASLQEEWAKEQEKTKKESIQITYSYWDGSGHRNKVVVTKGMTIGQFLEKARKDIAHEFQELRNLGGDGLMYIKEDLIIPQNYTFYDLIVTKARGKSGPLFHFDVHDDIRMNVDASVEKDESHAGKIVTKAYYERNKGNFPASRWEVYDPAVVRDKYTIKGQEVRGAFASKQ